MSDTVSNIGMALARLYYVHYVTINVTHNKHCLVRHEMHRARLHIKYTKIVKQLICSCMTELNCLYPINVGEKYRKRFIVCSH